LPFPIDFDGRPYNTLALSCERELHPNFEHAAAPPVDLGVFCPKRHISVPFTCNLIVTKCPLLPPRGENSTLPIPLAEEVKIGDVFDFGHSVLDRNR